MTRVSLVLCLSLLLGLTIVLVVSPAQASVESRLSRLEADVSQLRRQVNRLNSEVRQLNLSLDRERPNPVEVPSIAEREISTIAEHPMFDRLATLVVELKRRLDALEARLAALERGL